MATRVVAPLLLVAALALGWFALRVSESPENGAGSAPGLEGGAPATEPLTSELDSPAESHSERLEPVTADLPLQAPDSTGVELESNAPVDARGTVVLHELDGRLLETADGVLAVQVSTDEFGMSDSIRVVDGRFELAFDGQPVNTIQVIGGTLDGRSVVGQRADADLVAAKVEPEGGAFQLHCQLRGVLELEVLSAETGAPLGDVDIARIDGLDTVPGMQPDFLLRGGTSPLTIDHAQLTAEDLNADLAWWAVRAPDHAWRKVRMELAGDRKTVRLRPGGTLAVAVEGASTGRGLGLYFESEQNDGVRYELFLQGDGEYRLESVPAGGVRVAVQRGEWWDNPKVFGEATGTLLAGQELLLAVEVSAEAAEPTTMHEVEVEFVVPAGWNFETLWVWMDLLVSDTGAEGSRHEVLTPTQAFEPGRPQQFLLDLGRQPGGTWLAELPDVGWRPNFEVDRSGRYTLELPAPAVVTVTVTDPASGQPVADSELSWYTNADGPTRGTTHHQAEALPGIGQHRLVAPAGRIDLDADSESLGSSVRTFEVVPGEQALDMPLTLLAGFGLKLMDGEAPVTPQPGDLDLRMDGIGFDGEPVWTRAWHRNGTILQRRVPGRYELTLPELPGYLPIPTREVELVAGEFEEVVIQLERRP